MNTYNYEQCTLGLKESFTVTITPAMLESFRDITGDVNPLHNDEKYASSKGYPSKVVFGMMTSSFLSTLAGVYLPGKYSLIQEVETKFAGPVFINDTLTVTGEITDKNDLFKQITLKVRILNQEGATVLRGKMKILIKEDM